VGILTPVLRESSPMESMEASLESCNCYRV